MQVKERLRDLQALRTRNELFAKSKKAKLGQCDAFLSHSWSDDGYKKYRALRRWAHDFKLKNGREPDIWLDKACIDQNNISDDLPCLPIFTAGCNTLLIVAGPTYVSRLWCIVEVFVFLKMGGDVDRITVIPIDMSEREAENMFDNVDASACDCFLESDRQKLLGIIEHGFGNFESFNYMLRHVFKDRVARTKVFGSIRQSLRSLKNRMSTAKLTTDSMAGPPAIME